MRTAAKRALVIATTAAVASGLAVSSASASDDWVKGGIKSAHSRTAYSKQSEGRAWLHIYWNGTKVAVKGTVKNTSTDTYAYMQIRYQVYTSGKWRWHSKSNLGKVTPARGTGYLSLHRATHKTRYVQMRVCAWGLPGSGLGGKCMDWA
ncbi:hypothetical protein [Actinomadura violacea]|uniref:Uncharacterized protein n=1 Tax=Actinomadura violacea TaxID=2819934 RepID=A0ABS3RYD7_9ACTN|nr:hypothetical protein [Actinomadura violacea]MBO2461303.1 hypothetical protein [Actinomadura violacea]